MIKIFFLLCMTSPAAGFTPLIEGAGGLNVDDGGTP